MEYQYTIKVCAAEEKLSDFRWGGGAAQHRLDRGAVREPAAERGRAARSDREAQRLGRGQAMHVRVQPPCGHRVA